ncbi:unnamed protein product [Paramecium octaurelia]|uniref:Uncharacterized protein n=1 Tax=Paramecium octaurelia TaxID=43137 RepID=A0A8S1XLM8_PAROT|nr:unnamed protein product [Paramecium octaurelia]
MEIISLKNICIKFYKNSVLKKSAYLHQQIQTLDSEVFRNCTQLMVIKSKFSISTRQLIRKNYGFNRHPFFCQKQSMDCLATFYSSRFAKENFVNT